MTEVKTPKVTLISWTAHPLETVYTLWQQSKNEDELMTVNDVLNKVPPEQVRGLFREVIAQRIPIGEQVNFVFVLENISISWREQAVRHRIGTKASPERLGADMVVDVIPDLADSSWWSQSMRIQNMGTFADNSAYRVPESLAGKSVELEHGESCSAEALFRSTMGAIQDTYNRLVAAGVPMEDARELMPLGAQHRMSWALNIGSLQHIVGKRGCWILQLGIWGPVIMGMIQELARKVDPIFSELVTPPCFDTGSNKFKGCAYKEECRRRLDGSDKLPPCPLHLNYHVADEDQRGRLPLLMKSEGPFKDLPMRREMMERIPAYTQFWGRDCYTGEIIR